VEFNIVNLMNDFGYIGMFFGMILEAVIIVIPSEIILATGGILASKSIFNLFIVCLVGLFGSVFCAILIYMMGYYGGISFIEKYGKYFFMKKEDIEKSNKWFEKYGMLAALIGRNFPIIRTFISLPIGIARLNFTKFVIYTTIGSIPWTITFVLAGYYLGENWTILNSYIDKLKVPIILVIILLVLTYLYKKVIKPKVIYLNYKE
jgi:membrane protein DedA with SNARE-associated domain